MYTKLRGLSSLLILLIFQLYVLDFQFRQLNLEKIRDSQNSHIKILMHLLWQVFQGYLSDMDLVSCVFLFHLNKLELNLIFKTMVTIKQFSTFFLLDRFQFQLLCCQTQPLKTNPSNIQVKKPSILFLLEQQYISAFAQYAKVQNILI